MRTGIFIFIFVFSILAIFYFLFSHSDLSSETFVASIDLSSNEFLETGVVQDVIPKEPLKTLPYINEYSQNSLDKSNPSELHSYLTITNGCGTVVEKTCAHAYASATTSSSVRATLRIGMVLLIKDTITAPNSTLWYSVTFDEDLRYGERLTLPWFVPAEYGEINSDIGQLYADASTTQSSKSIIVDRSEQILYAYEGEELFLETPVSTGLLLTPTPRGTFTVFMKTPTRYMQGPIPGISDQYYDLPGVPWNLYFTKQGAVIHGAYWHNSFGKPWSHGCVNLPPDIAKKIYIWADLGMTVTIRD
ncbi:hypothetical protein CO026_00865 [Candidatus Kaiserbacteria bacterium CG_4_9_14_0_2_um_filter_41_32]|uniref:L,D-TPase catalytic domain-containing protein n=1 Tax=Candidatus Kaiserbacteria bacterium CG_4_9_14_0_2_um_filter_41_32 TaxID=1974601 RepID=A0A2M8FFD8_9BACT|nr:MAG: hypothetical protein CO026_00865 [Candidatus Kaiserbacteria bacterium CG_4_9_14_0_2_um_filter_41_32]